MTYSWQSEPVKKTVPKKKSKKVECDSGICNGSGIIEWYDKKDSNMTVKIGRMCSCVVGDDEYKRLCDISIILKSNDKEYLSKKRSDYISRDRHKELLNLVKDVALRTSEKLKGG